MKPEGEATPGAGETPPQASREHLLSNPEVLVDAIKDILAARALQLDAEQAIRGLDALPELGFHPVLAAGLSAHGLGVVREALFPGDVEAMARRRVKRAERERCDLVLLPRPDAMLLDPVRQHVERDEMQRTLFAAIQPRAPAEGVRPEDAYWLEVKAVGQFTYTNGWLGPNGAYASELTRATSDLDKIARDRHILRGGLLIILFTRDRATADHDLGVLLDRCLARDVPMRTPSIARFAIGDRMGNALCTLWLAPARCGDHDAARDAHH
jgi:hypothetical protein